MKREYIQPQTVAQNIETGTLLIAVSTSDTPIDGDAACTMGVSLDESSDEVW